MIYGVFTMTVAYKDKAMSDKKNGITLNFSVNNNYGLYI